MFSLRHPRAESKEGEVDFVHHIHTRYSDGSSKPMHVVKRALRGKYKAAITDHNNVRGIVELVVRSQRSPKNRQKIEKTIIPGCEYQTRSGEELLAYGTGENFMEAAKRLIKFHAKLKPLLNTWEPIFDPVDISFEDFLELAEKYKIVLGVPHLEMPVHGIGNRDKRELNQAGRDLASYPHPTFVETHQYLSDASNEAAIAFATRHGLDAILAGSDSHGRKHDASRTRITLIAGEPATITTMFESMRLQPPTKADRTLARPSTSETIKDALEVLRNMNIRGKWIQVRNQLWYWSRKMGTA